MKYKDLHKKLHHISLVAIWLLSICVCQIPVFADLFQQDELYHISRNIILHGLHTTPIVLIVVMYLRLIWILQRGDTPIGRFPNSSSTTISNVKCKQLKIMQGVVACLVICYLPYLAWWQYSTIVLADRDPYAPNLFEVISKEYQCQYWQAKQY